MSSFSFITFLLITSTFSIPLSSLSLLSSYSANLSVYDPILNAGKNFLNEIFGNTTSSSQCYEWLSSVSLQQIFEYSGEDISDLGNEIECDSIDFFYSIFIYKFDTSTTLFSDPTKKAIITLLQNNAYFYTGVCIPQICTDFLNKSFVFNSNTSVNEIIKNHSLNEYLTSIGINEMQYVHKKDKFDKEKSTTYTPFIACFTIMIVYLVVKLFFSILYECCYSNKSRSISNTDKSKNSNNNKNKNKGMSSSSGYKSNMKSKKKNSLSRDEDFLFNNTNYIDNNSDELSNMTSSQSGIAFMSFTHNMDLISANRSMYFDENNLKVLSLIKTIIMFLLVYNHNYFASTIFPGRDFFNDTFYTSFYFSTIKITVYSADCFVALESFVMIFKLMSFLREKYFTKSEPLYKIIGVFIIMTIPKIILFFTNFYFLHYFMPNIASMFSSSAWNKYYLSTISKEKECENNIFLSIIPFYLGYNDFNTPSTRFNLANCHRFFYVFINEFVCFIVFMIIFFIMLKLKSKIFDGFIAIIVIINTICSFLSFTLNIDEDTSQEKRYDSEMIFGQVLTLKHTHLLFNTYMFGIFAGMIYFYYNDYLANHSIQKEHKYYPFSFCSAIVPLLDFNSTVMKGIVLLITFVLQFAFGMTYNIFRLIFKDKENGLAFKINSFVEWFNYYDKQVYVIVFLIMTILLMFTSKDNVIHNIASFRLFNLISRISFSIFSSLDYIIYLSFIIFNFQIKMSYANMLFTSVGQFIIVVVVCMVFTILFEFPFRVLVKKMLRSYTRGNDANNNVLDDKTVYY